MDKEIRSVNSRAEFNEDSRTVSGYALLFEHESRDICGFTEIISRGALDGVLEKSDVLALLDHDSRNGILARYRKKDGSLKLSVDEKGLRYEFEIPDTALGNELLASMKRGDVDESSFAFSVAEEEWSKKTDGTQLRRINKFMRIYDVSPVYFPAYEGTKVGLRSASDVLKDRESREIAEKERLEIEEKRNALAGYYETIDRIY